MQQQDDRLVAILMLHRHHSTCFVVQSFLGMPRTVGLDLAADDIDVAQPLPALAVAEVDFLAAPGLDPRADPSDTRYLCLTADNRLPALSLSRTCYARQPEQLPKTHVWTECLLHCSFTLLNCSAWCVQALPCTRGPT